MLVLWGTMPIEDLDLKEGPCKYDRESLTIGDYLIPSHMVLLGTSAMISAATVMCEALGVASPYATIAGDLGEGAGSRKLYTFLTTKLRGLKPKVLAMHYILPVREPYEEFMKSLETWEERPILVGDAGTILIAKATGTCKKFDVFTPDPGEISYLADPDADHPAYTQHYFFGVRTSDVPFLITQAYEHGNVPRAIVVKGPVDHIAIEGKVVATVSEPNVPSLEPIGGTGDTITGTLSALLHAGYDVAKACEYAAKVNRVAGALAKPTPSTRISEIIPFFPEAWRKVKEGSEA